MSEILSEDKPIYEDSKTVVYKIPKPNSSEPFLLLGSGWHAFEPENHLRVTMKNFEILIVNPTDSEMAVTLNLVLGSDRAMKKLMAVSINNEKLMKLLTLQLIHGQMIYMIENLILKPGINVVTFDTMSLHYLKVTQ